MFYKSPKEIKKELKESYSHIAADFSASRARPWPEFDFFCKYISDGASVLDLGCGDARFYDYLKKKRHDIDYTGVDFCPEFIKLAKAKNPQLDFFEMDISQLDLGRYFDCVISVAGFHHLPSGKERLQTLKKIFEHLNEDGVFIFSVWNLWQFKYWKNILTAFLGFFLSLFRSDPRDLYIPFGKNKVPRFYHAFFPWELNWLLKKSSFKIETFKISRHNFIYVCKKNMLVTGSYPLFADKKKLLTDLGKNTAVATFKKI